MKIMVNIIEQVKKYLEKNAQDRISSIAGQSAFFVILSAVPFLMFMFAVMTALGISQNILVYYSQFDSSSRIGAYIQNFINETYSSSEGIAFTTIIMSLWSAGSGVFSVSEGIGVIYKLEDRRNWLVKRLEAMAYTVIMFVILVITPFGFVLVEVFENFIDKHIYKLPFAVAFLFSFRHIITLIVFTILIAAVLKIYLMPRLKNKKYSHFRAQLPGAFVTALGFMLVSRIMNAYVEYFNGFSLYGSLACLAGVMLWIYATMYIFLCGVQFNYIYRRQISGFRILKAVKREKRKLKHKTENVQEEKAEQN